MRSLLALVVVTAVGACARSAIRVTVQGNYEVGEEATVVVDAPDAHPSTPIESVLVLVRPDGTEVREPATLVQPTTRLKFADPPTFRQLGRHRITLVSDGKPLAAPVDVAVNIDRLGELLSETVGDHKAKTRTTRPRQLAGHRWKQYIGIYEHPWRAGFELEVMIEEPGGAFRRVWAEYEEEGTLEVMERSYVRLRERAESATARWTSRGRIISLRATSLERFAPKFVARMLVRFPSDLKPG